MATPQSEKQLCNAIVEFLNYSGCFCWRNNAGLIPVFDKYGKQRRIKVGRKGEPDIIGVRRKDGRFIGLEVKTPKRRKKVTLAQQLFLTRLQNYGAIAAVVCSPEEALHVVTTA